MDMMGSSRTQTVEVSLGDQPNIKEFISHLYVLVI
jgi:hypothetical protein